MMATVEEPRFHTQGRSRSTSEVARSDGSRIGRTSWPYCGAGATQQCFHAHARSGAWRTDSDHRSCWGGSGGARSGLCDTQPPTAADQYDHDGASFWRGRGRCEWRKAHARGTLGPAARTRLAPALAAQAAAREGDFYAAARMQAPHRGRMSRLSVRELRTEKMRGARLQELLLRPEARLELPKLLLTLHVAGSDSTREVTLEPPPFTFKHDA